MANKIRNFIYYPITFLILFTVISCHEKHTVYKTDIDNLYAIKRDIQDKDSIAQSIQDKTKRALNSKNTKKDAQLIDSVIDVLRWTNEKKAFLKLNSIAHDDAILQNDQTRLANTYHDLAVFYHDEGQLDSVYYYYLKAENIFKKNGDSLPVAENNFYQSRLLYELGLQMESEVKLSKSLKILQDFPKNPLLIEAYQLMSLYNIEHGEFDKALINLKKAEKILQDDEGKFEVLPRDKFYLAYSALYANISFLYIETKEYSKAVEYSTKGIEYIQYNYTDLGFAFINLEHQLAQHYNGTNPDVIGGLLISYNLFDKLKHIFFQADTAKIISNIYSELGDKSNSLKWAWTSYNLAKKDKFFKKQKEAIELILLNDKDYPTPALVKELIDLNKVLEVEQKETREKFAKIEYETFLLVKENQSLRQKIAVILAISTVVTIGLAFIIFYFRLKNKNKELFNLNIQKSKNEKILNLLIENNNIEHKSIQKERNRISKDLHDGVINSLFTLRFNLQQMDSANKEMQQLLIKEIINLEQTVREISHSLAKSSLLKNKSFENLLVELVNKQSNNFKTVFTITLEDDLSFEHLTTLQKVNIYHILQETLQNINKHSYATKCQINVTSTNDKIVFETKDNGIGIKGNRINGLGLNSMKERAQAIKADFKIISKINKGTTITLAISY